MVDEDEPSAIEKRTEIEEDIESLKQQLASLREQWETEKMGLDDVQGIRQEAAQLQHRFTTLDAEAKQKQLRGESPESLYREMLQVQTRQRELEAKLNEFEKRDAEKDKREASATPDGRRLLRKEVTEEEIAEVVSTWTGVPISRMMETEKAKLLVMEETSASASDRST